MDSRIIDYLASEFKKENGVDIKADPMALQRLKEGAEKAKHELSSTTMKADNNNSETYRLDVQVVGKPYGTECFISEPSVN